MIGLNRRRTTMSKQNIAAVPEEDRMEELLGRIKPVPSERFHQKMKQTTWQIENPDNHHKNRIHRRLRVALPLTVLLLVAGLFIGPRGRAWAQEVLQFFSRIN